MCKCMRIYFRRAEINYMHAHVWVATPELAFETLHACVGDTGVRALACFPRLLRLTQTLHACVGDTVCGVYLCPTVLPCSSMFVSVCEGDHEGCRGQLVACT